MTEKTRRINAVSNGIEGNANTLLFESAEEAWFWFIDAQGARNDGARFTAGLGIAIRPCEPVDILKILDRLYRQRMLRRDHFLVLRHYGRRMIPPDQRRTKEIRAYKLWKEAMEKLTPVLERKGIISSQNWAARCYPQYANYETEGIAAE